LFLLLPSNNFMLTRALLMNPVVAPSAARHVRLPTTVVVEIVLNAKGVKCMMQFVLAVAKRPRYLSSPVVINPCIAATATDPAIAGKKAYFKSQGVGCPGFFACAPGMVY